MGGHGVSRFADGSLCLRRLLHGLSHGFTSLLGKCLSHPYINITVTGGTSAKPGRKQWETGKRLQEGRLFLHENRRPSCQLLGLMPGKAVAQAGDGLNVDGVLRVLFYRLPEIGDRR